VPLEPLLEPVIEAIEAGVVSYVGLSNCSLDQVQAARAKLPPGRLVSVQNRYNISDRSSEVCPSTSYLLLPLLCHDCARMQRDTAAVASTCGVSRVL
jgi:aryl-alcohol dehydrogenase-like predicted oxidoreductase